MSLTDRERGIAKVFGAEKRRRERHWVAILFVVSFLSGLFGAYLGVKAVFEAFSAVAVAIAANVAIAWVRKMFSGDKNA